MTSEQQPLPTATVKGGARPKHRRHLSNYLLDKSLQLRYIVFVTLLSTVICGVLGYLIYRQEHRASAAILETMESMPGGDEWKEIRAAVDHKLTEDDSSLVTVMVMIGLGLVFVLTLYLTLMTHKVAGPLHKVSGYFDRMRDGRLGDTWPLRKGDMLMDFYTSFKSMHDRVRDRFRQDNDVVGRFLKECDRAKVSREGEVGKQLNALEAHHKEREETLACD